MMYDIRIGDRQNDFGFAFAKATIKIILQIENIRLAIRKMLVIHAMIGRDNKRHAQRVELADIGVKHRVEIERPFLSGTIFMLNEIGR